MPDIKTATFADISLIRDLALKVWPQTYTPILGPQQVAYMLDLFYAPGALKKQMEEPGHKFIICYADNLPAAFAAWSKIEAHIFKLHKLYILPGNQGKGIGRFMIDHIINELKSEGAHELRLNVNRYNHAAISFYEKTGFKLLDEEDIDIGGGYYMNDYMFGVDI